jgi:pantothenate kinase type III
MLRVALPQRCACRVAGRGYKCTWRTNALQVVAFRKKYDRVSLQKDPTIYETLALSAIQVGVFSAGIAAVQGTWSSYAAALEKSQAQQAAAIAHGQRAKALREEQEQQQRQAARQQKQQEGGKVQLLARPSKKTV